ncbi:MAG: hypothetical protein ABIZ50_00080 [Solirubrobacterales bacterium]
MSIAAFTSMCRPLLAAPVAIALIATGCGSGSDSDPAQTSAPSASAFPEPAGKTLEQLARGGTQSDLAVAPSEQVFSPGENRYAFGVFTVDGKNVADAQVAIYASRPGKPAVGPYTASSSSLETDAAFRSQTTANDPDAATYVYTTDVDFDHEGQWQMLAMMREGDGKYSVSAVQPADVGGSTKIPGPGDAAPVIHTPTAEDVGGDLAKIDTRTPADTMHDVDFADVVGKEPVVLVFATPALCTSRVCGPVVDIAEQVKNERPDDAAFIHMEIYEDNDPNKGPRQQVLDFGMQSEPWLFVIGADGKVSTRIEGAFSEAELNAAIDKASNTG